jgi:formate-dependent nitrite reductase membrane component NrfD
MTWSAPIYIYLWLAGMAGGAYFTAFLADRFTGGGNRRLLRLATYLGIPLAVIGVMLLVADLGQPIRFWHLLTEFKVTSPMSMGTWILLIWVGLAVIMAVLWWAERFLSEEASSNLRGMTEPLAWIDLVLSVLLIAYTGVLLAVSSQPLWAGTVLLPALFVASAISTGVAILIITALIATAITKGGWTEVKLAINQLTGTTDWTISNRTVERLAEADAVVIVVELAALIGYAIWLATSTMAGAGDALKLLTTGTLAAPFWIGVVLLALLIPLGLDIFNWGKQIETKVVSRAIILSSVCVILGGLVLRAVITTGGQL